MSTKKIDWGKANRIAAKISQKAFAHLIEPFEKEEKEIASAAFEKVLETFDANKLVSFGFANRNSSLNIHLIGSKTKDDILVQIPCVDMTVNKYLSVNGYGDIKLHSPDLYALAMDMFQRKQPFVEKCNELEIEIRSQLEGKTVTTAIKAWPEAASIINDVMGISDIESMTQPLEVLLGRFLPQLPAPKE